MTERQREEKRKKNIEINIHFDEEHERWENNNLSTKWKLVSIKNECVQQCVDNSIVTSTFHMNNWVSAAAAATAVCDSQHIDWTLKFEKSSWIKNNKRKQINWTHKW